MYKLMIEIFQLRGRSHRKVFSSLGFSFVPGCLGKRALFRLGFAAAALIALTGQAQTQPLLMTKIVTVPSSAIATGNGLVTVNWTGGTAPFQVECSTGFDGNWQDVDGITYGFSQTNILTAPTALYRVADVAATIAASSDKTAPSVPTGLAPTTASSIQVNLTWNASVDGGTNASGVKGYNVYRNGIFLKQVAAPGTAAADTGLTPLTTNDYAVSAVDNAYNQSARSSSASASTPASGNCAFIISPLNATFSSAGGGSNLTVTAGAGCSWTAISSAVWTTITSGASVTGNGTVGFSVSANTNFSTRTGTMTVAAQTVTVTQAAAADTTAPTVSLTTPTSGSTVSNTISLTASASDNVGVTKVVFYRDGTTLVGTATAAPFSVSDNTTNVSNGVHSYCAWACDAATNSTPSASNVITVSNVTVPTATPGQLQWLRTMVSPNGYNAEGQSIAADSSGNVIVAGDFNKTVDFGSGPSSSATGNNVFIAKYTSQGGLLWNKVFTSQGNDFAKSVITDSRSNIIVAGYFSGTMDFGGVALTAPDPYQVNFPDMFVAKYSSSGSLLWVRQFGGSSGDFGTAVAVDGSDNVVLAGRLQSANADFGGGITLSAAGSSSLALVKLSPSGTTLWAKVYGGPNTVIPRGMAIDRFGDIAVTGQFMTSADFGGGAISSSAASGNLGTFSTFLAKYSGTDGSYRWAKAFGRSEVDGGFGIVTDPVTGNIVATGGFMGTADFGGGPVSSGGEAVFLAGYDPSGTFLWVQTYGGSGSWGNAVKIDANGNLALTGVKAGPWNVGGTWNFSTGFFVLTYAISGNTPPVLRWSKFPGAGSTASSPGNGIALDALGHVLTTGSFSFGTVDFGGIWGTTTPNSGYGFVAEYTR
jgi:hypothetical protein